MNILEQADNIVNKRSEEKDRMYGPFSEGMDRAAMIFNGMTGLNITGKEMFKALVALKLSRESYNHREDNLLDACAYLGALNNYEDEKTPNTQSDAYFNNEIGIDAIEEIKRLNKKI